MNAAARPRGTGQRLSQWVLALLLLAEIAIFSVTGKNFATLGNGLEILRLSVEVGLLAIALTPVIVTGGIDLSVGSLLGLSAVAFGKLHRDAGLPWPAAAAATLALGGAAGLLNAGLITRLRIPPLIVTLGSYSLFRGLALGLTAGVDNFTNFPVEFQFLGQGYIAGVIPAQLPVLLASAALFGILLHKTTLGRVWSASGYSPEGALYAGLRVDRHVGLAYVLSGVLSSLAALIYSARVNQAKADAGTGFELLAITAVVLGGTSISGGQGSILGTLLGLLAISILQTGLLLSDQPAELAGIAIGALLIASIALRQTLSQRSRE